MHLEAGELILKHSGKEWKHLPVQDENSRQCCWLGSACDQLKQGLHSLCLDGLTSKRSAGSIWIGCVVLIFLTWSLLDPWMAGIIAEAERIPWQKGYQSSCKCRNNGQTLTANLRLCQGTHISLCGKLLTISMHVALIAACQAHV